LRMQSVCRALEMDRGIEAAARSGKIAPGERF